MFLCGFPIKPGKRLNRWPSCCFVYLLDGETFTLAMWGWGWPGWMWSVISTPACWSVDMHHLKRVEAEIGLCGFTKLNRSLLDFQILFLTSLYFSRCDKAQISVSLYHIKTIGSRWCLLHVCLSSSGTNIVTLSISNFIRSKFI